MENEGKYYKHGKVTRMGLILGYTQGEILNELYKEIYMENNKIYVENGNIEKEFELNNSGRYEEKKVAKRILEFERGKLTEARKEFKKTRLMSKKKMEKSAIFHCKLIEPKNDI